MIEPAEAGDSCYAKAIARFAGSCLLVGLLLGLTRQGLCRRPLRGLVFLTRSHPGVWPEGPSCNSRDRKVVVTEFLNEFGGPQDRHDHAGPSGLVVWSWAVTPT
jgi:hypothetical protein